MADYRDLAIALGGGYGQDTGGITPDTLATLKNGKTASASDLLGMLKAIGSGSLSNLESLVRGGVAQVPGAGGDLEGLARMGINKAFGAGGVNVNPTPVLPTTTDILGMMPRNTAARPESAGMEELGGYMSPAFGKVAVKAIKATEGMPVGMSIKDVGKGSVMSMPKSTSLLDMTRTPSEAEIKKLSREDLINWLQNNDPNGQYLDPTPSPSISMYQTARGYNIEDAGTGRVFEFGDYNKAKKEFDALRYAASEFQPMTLQEAQESAINYLREFAQPAESAKVLQLKPKALTK